MRFRNLMTALLLFAALAGQAVVAAPAQETPAAADKPAAATDDKAAAAKKEEPKIKAYKDVITAEAVTDTGVFNVHRVKNKTYYEIPRQELGKEFLWVSQIAKTTNGRGYGGAAAGNYVVRWELRDKRVLLRGVSYKMVADPSLPVARAVDAANYQPIIMAFNVEAFGADGAPVIEVSKLFTTEVPEFTVRRVLRAKGFDTERSFLERAVAFPQNIEVEATHTFTAPPDDGERKPPPKPYEEPAMKGGAASVLMHYSMVKLPEKPMMPRLFDERVGYFSVKQTDFGVDQHRAVKREYVTRYRLEKKDPSAALSEPVKPIVYWIDSATPAKWVPYIRKGIEDWQPAFEAAGFKNGIIAKDAPTPEQDPEWSAEDARYSVIRWLPSTVENASGPHINDPRTGEILEADIQFHHNVMNLLRNWYFVQAGPLDPRVRTLPMPDELMGELLRYVVAHEVGHTLGFQHNMKASSQYPAEKVRDPAWVKANGHVATLMDYSRMNYVAQPEDGIAVEDLIPKIGPYDKWATHWGYAPIPEARTPDEEKKTLNAWAREQDKTPWYRFSTKGAMGIDPGDEIEAVGDADAIASTELGLKNLARVADMLIPAATAQPGETYETLDELYENMLGQWSREMGHVVGIVGGFDSQQKHVGQEGPVFVPVPAERQRQAVAFLNRNAFMPLTFAMRPDILSRIEPVGSLERIAKNQSNVLKDLLNPARVERVMEQAAVNPATAYQPTELLADIRHGIWQELDNGSVNIDPYRRNIQRAHLALLSQNVGMANATDDSRSLFRGELVALEQDVRKAQRKARDPMTRLHLEDVSAEIRWALDPQRPLAAAPVSGPYGLTDEAQTPLSCWPQYVER